MNLVLVTSFRTNNVLMYDDKGNFQGVFGEANLFDSGLIHPRNIIADQNGNIYVSSFGTNQVLKYDQKGQFLGEFAPVNGPVGLAFDSSGDLYIASYSDNKVLRYDLNGTLVDDQFIPSGDNGLLNVTGIIFDQNDNLYVNYYGDFERINRGGVLKYDSSGNFIEVFTDYSEIHPDGSRLNGPYEIAFDDNSNYYISSLAPPYYVLHYENDGTPLGIFGEVNDIDTPDLSDPHGLIFDPNGDLLVTASTNSNILRFTSNGDSLGVFGEASNALSLLDAPTDIVFTTSTFVTEKLKTPVYRFQNKDIPSTYLYAGEQEAQNIRQNYPNFKEEGFAFNVST
ncbi:NHL repeat-containing protein, partial [Geminocystis sp. GBBB08]|uniref:NHL repeat-containing protein n=1 Tax=Geminocystis sp. GBBB08 TaxID=2604140 RepID=UPI0027E2CC59